jgi:DNA-binding response OmpR family regulator
MTKRIMLIEDDLDTQNLYRECLRAENYEVDCLANAQDALELIQKVGLPDLILMDLNFPLLPPENFLKCVRNTEKGKRIPVLLISGKVDIEEQAVHLGAKGFLKKPFDIEPFLSIISSTLNPLKDPPSIFPTFPT